MRPVVILALVLAILASALASDAQRPARIPRIGMIYAGSASPVPRAIEAFRHGLRELGCVEGQNIAVEYRVYPADRDDLLPEIAGELVRTNVDLIVTSGTTVTRAVKHSTSTIPIVMVAVGDPVGTGFAASLARPGGNLTGLTNMAKLAGKRLQLLKDLAPKAAFEVRIFSARCLGV